MFAAPQRLRRLPLLAVVACAALGVAGVAMAQQSGELSVTVTVVRSDIPSQPEPRTTTSTVQAPPAPAPQSEPPALAPAASQGEYTVVTIQY